MEYELLTQNGLNANEVISALQKHIRRGNEVEALKCMLELCPKYDKWMWRRLMVISLEDIGPANPDLHVQLRALKETYLEFKEEDKKGSDLLVLTNVALLMCRSEKSRIGDNFGCVVKKEWLEQAFEIPDYALDKHTLRGKKMGRGIEYFIEEGAKLCPEPTYFDPYKIRAEKNWLEGFTGGPMVKAVKPGQQKMFDEE